MKQQELLLKKRSDGSNRKIAAAYQYIEQSAHLPARTGIGSN